MDKHHLPRPRWCFVLLAIPTFYMPLAYFAGAVWMFGCILLRQLALPPEWMKAAYVGSLPVAFALWPIYIAWVLLTKRLRWREKCVWLLIVCGLNMFGMPAFFVFMVRRYLGLENRFSPGDERAVDRFLLRRGVSRERLSTEQQAVLLRYCRHTRWGRWVAVPAIPFALLVLYSLTIFWEWVPAAAVDSGIVSSQMIVYHTVTNTQIEVLPDPEVQRSGVGFLLLMGAGLGVLFVGGVILLLRSIKMLTSDLDVRWLIQFLKATEATHSVASVKKSESPLEETS